MTDEDAEDAAGDAAVSPATDDTAGDEREWQFSVDEVGDDDPDGAADATGAGDSDETEEGSNVAGSLLDLDEEIEPGAPTLEGTVFVVLGALATVLFLLEAGGAL
jgi:hypothetical protein